MNINVVNELMSCSVVELAQYSSIIAGRLVTIDANNTKGVKVNNNTKSTTKSTTTTKDTKDAKDKYSVKHDIKPKFILDGKVVKLDGYVGKKAFYAIKEVVKAKTGIEYEKNVGWTFKTKVSASDFVKSELIITAKEANDIWERMTEEKTEKKSK